MRNGAQGEQPAAGIDGDRLLEGPRARTEAWGGRERSLEAGLALWSLGHVTDQTGGVQTALVNSLVKSQTQAVVL